jgi:hypothetical protein
MSSLEGELSALLALRTAAVIRKSYLEAHEMNEGIKLLQSQIAELVDLDSVQTSSCAFPPSFNINHLTTVIR